jgi:hypothetical protein
MPEPDSQRHGGQLGLVTQFGKKYDAERTKKDGEIHMVSRKFPAMLLDSPGKCKAGISRLHARPLLHILLTPSGLLTRLSICPFKP